MSTKQETAAPSDSSPSKSEPSPKEPQAEPPKPRIRRRAPKKGDNRRRWKAIKRLGKKKSEGKGGSA